MPAQFWARFHDQQSDFFKMEQPVGSDALRIAARHVEDAAFDLAAMVESELVAQMIIIAAELERLARQVDKRLEAESRNVKNRN